MASKVCTQCLRAIQRQSRPQSQWASRAISRCSPSRSLSTAPRKFQEKPLAETYAVTHEQPPVTPVRAEGEAQNSPVSKKALQGFQKLARGTTNTYTAYGATEFLYQECARQAHYTIPQASKDDEEMPKTEDGEDLGVGEGWWISELGLQPTFSTWSQVTMLHMYLLSARFRCFETHIAQPWQQHLLDHFFYDAENRMTIEHNMHARGTRNKYLKDLFIQWRGVLAAYDEGLARGDAVLAAAVWRNVFKAKEDVDVRAIAQIVSYMRRVLKGLDKTPDEDIQGCKVEFGSPEEESAVVALRSKMMDTPFEEFTAKAMPGKKQA